MNIDTSGLYGWPSPDTIESASSTVGAAGNAYLSAVEETGEIWKQLRFHYSGNGEEEIVDAFRTATPNAQLLADSAEHVLNVLKGFACGIRLLEAERAQLLMEIETAAARGEGTGVFSAEFPDKSQTATESLLLPGRVSSLVGRFRQFEEQTAAELSMVPNGGGPLLNAATSVGGTVAAGAASVVLNSYTSRRVQVWDPHAVYTRYPDRENRIANMARGWWNLEMWRERKINQWEFRPQISRDLYNHSESYRARVDADRSQWAPKAERFSDLTSSAKGMRIGGGILAVGTAFLTVRNERQDAYNEILHTNPAIAEDDLNKRANLVGGVKGGTKAAIDLGAAVTGAAIGTVIGGPAGTIAGAAIGVGISVATSVEFDFLGGRSLKDAFADGSMSVLDGFLDSGIGSAAVEGVTDLWNSLWG